MGYNMTLGGQGTFGFGKIDEGQVAKIKEMIRDVDDSLVSIALEMDVPVSTVRSIYQGEAWNYVPVDGFSQKWKGFTNIGFQKKNNLGKRIVNEK